MADTGAMVESNIATVEAAYAQALDNASGGFFTLSDPYKVQALRALKGPLDAWAARGRSAAAAGDAPGNGWAGWVAAGQNYIANFPGLSLDGATFALSSIADSTAKAVGEFADRVSDVSLDVAGTVGHTLKWVGIGAVVVVLGLVALKYGPSRGGS